MSQPATLPRRQFAKNTAAAIFGFQIVPRHVIGGPGFTPPSEKVNLGCIGIGGQGGGDIRDLDDSGLANIVALCDVDLDHSAGTIKKYPNAKLYRDYRELIDKQKDIDAVLVATPCTAPFMGSALGLTLTQPAWQAMAIFTVIGLGMALPYALLGAYPHWLKALPRPGRWMQTLREALAFPMYASAAWLAWVLARQAGADAVLRLLLAAVVMAAGAWAWGRFSAPPAARLRLALMSLLLAIGVSFALLAPLQTDAGGQASSGSSNAMPC